MPATARTPPASRATTESVGFLLAKASTHWNDVLTTAFAERGFPEVRPSYGSVLLPLFEREGSSMSEITAAARQPKQTTTTLVRQMERDGLVHRIRDSRDGRVWRVHLTRRAIAFKQVAEEVLADLDARLAEHLTRPAAEALKGSLRSVMEL